jgi:putative glycosyltransferase
MYYSAPYLDEFHQRVTASVKEITNCYEIIFVNDGSPDDALAVAIRLHEKDQCVKIIDLSRNFGHHKAIMTGLTHAQGDLAFLLDCDLEEAPELLQDFYQTMMTSNADVVYGVQKHRKGHYFERISGRMFYTLFNLLSNYPIPENLITARLMRKRYVSSLIQHKDQEIFLAGLLAITGFKQEPIHVNKDSKGSSAYSLKKKLSLFANSITSFSNKPLIFISYLGLTISLISSFAALYLIIQRVFFGVFLTGWPSLIVSIWLLGGITIFCLGVIGIYLAKVFMETKERPYTIIRQIYAYEREK